jgi:hypothetical protein
MLLTMGAFPTYFMMSMGVGTDPLSAGLCAWIGICVMQGVARGTPLPARRAEKPPTQNRTAACVPRRFGRLWAAQAG